MRQPTREELEIQKLAKEVELLALQGEMLRTKINPRFASGAFTKVAHFILSYGAAGSTALGTGCFALAAGAYTGGVSQQYCRDLSNGPVRDSCHIAAFGVGCMVAGTGFFATAKVLNEIISKNNMNNGSSAEPLKLKTV